MDWIDLVNGSDQWKALVTFGFHTMLRNSGVAAQLVAFQKGLSSMYL
jgi:hypothetical protein